MGSEADLLDLPDRPNLGLVVPVPVPVVTPRQASPLCSWVVECRCDFDFAFFTFGFAGTVGGAGAVGLAGAAGFGVGAPAAGVEVVGGCGAAAALASAAAISSGVIAVNGPVAGASMTAGTIPFWGAGGPVSMPSFIVTMRVVSSANSGLWVMSAMVTPWF